MRQSNVPIADHPFENLAKARQILELLLHLAELSRGNGADLQTGRVAAVPRAEELLQLVERKAQRQRALNQQDTLERFGRIDAISVVEPPRLRQQPSPLVVPQRVHADARVPRDLAGTVPVRNPHRRHARQSRPRNRFGSQARLV